MEALAWDTEFFGFRIGRADMRRRDLEETIADARAQDLECVYLSFPARDLLGAENAIRRGARLVELRLRLFVRLDEVVAALDPRVRFADESDRPHLLEVTHRGSRLSRFARDPHFDDARVRELYERMLERCLTEGMVILSSGGRSVWAAYPDGKAAEVALVEVDPAERHLGLSLAMSRAAAHMRPTTHDYVSGIFVNIDASRTPALRLAHEMGLRIRSATVLLHLWLDELA